MEKNQQKDILSVRMQHLNIENNKKSKNTKQIEWIARLEFLFKYSRQEVGALKAYIDELEYERKQYLSLTIAELAQYKKDELFRKLNKEILMLREENNKLHKDVQNLVRELTILRIKNKTTIKNDK